ncbi:hypothetical protein BGW41_006341 [Actinomortierella wolfii]|nr:hypothetical protein BGW41_006341 [Actinomortierella wolfii]
MKVLILVVLAAIIGFAYGVPILYRHGTADSNTPKTTIAKVGHAKHGAVVNKPGSVHNGNHNNNHNDNHHASRPHHRRTDIEDPTDKPNIPTSIQDNPYALAVIVDTPPKIMDMCSKSTAGEYMTMDPHFQNMTMENPLEHETTSIQVHHAKRKVEDPAAGQQNEKRFGKVSYIHGNVREDSYRVAIQMPSTIGSGQEHRDVGVSVGTSHVKALSPPAQPIIASLVYKREAGISNDNDKVHRRFRQKLAEM